MIERRFGRDLVGGIVRPISRKARVAQLCFSWERQAMGPARIVRPCGHVCMVPGPWERVVVEEGRKIVG